MSLKLESFNADVRQKYPSCTERFDDIEEMLVEVEKHSPWEMPGKYCLMTSRSPFFKTYMLVSCCSLRSIDITNGIISLVNTNNTSCLVFLIRAQLETSGLLAILHKQLQLLKEHGNHQVFDTKLEKLIIGGRKIGDVPSFHAEELIRTIDSEMSSLEDQENTKPYEKGIYSSLCEEVHPNWLCLWGKYCRWLEDGSLEFKKQETLEDSELRVKIGFVLAALHPFLLFADKCITLVKTIPDFLIRE